MPVLFLVFFVVGVYCLELLVLFVHRDHRDGGQLVVPILVLVRLRRDLPLRADVVRRGLLDVGHGQQRR